MTKQKTKVKKEFPNIYRFIPAFVLCLMFLILVALMGLDLHRNLQEKNKADVKRQEIMQKLHYWEEVVEKYKGYRDGYFQAALLAYQLGENGKSNVYLQKALELDPNFEEGRRLEKVLSSKY